MTASARFALPIVALLAALAGCAGTASFKSRAIKTDAEILNLGPMPDELRELYVEDGYDTVGYHYERFAIFDADVWSWDGKFIFYRKQPEISVQGFRTIHTTYYLEIDDELVDRYGWGTPIEYRIPPGMLVALCLLELAIVARRKRRAKRVLAIGIGLVAFAGVLFLLGMTWPCAFPLVLGVFHIVTALPILQPADAAQTTADDDDDPPYKKTKPADVASAPLLPPAPNFEKDPFRGPPQPPPIVVKRPPTAPTSTPVVRDENAEAPKLLR